MDETLFEREYKRIGNLIRILIRISLVNALMNFWNPGYKYFIFGDIDMTPTIKEYTQILNFPNNPYKVYFRTRLFYPFNVFLD